MPNFLEYSPEQAYLLPPSVRDVLGEDHLVFFVHGVVERLDLAKFEEFAKKRKLELAKISRDDLVDFLAGLYRQKLESKTVARHVVTLRNFFRYAHMQDAIAEDPAMNLESPKIRKSLPGYLRLEDVERLLQQPDGSTVAGLRDRAMLEVLYSTGLRVSELTGLKVSDCDTTSTSLNNERGGPIGDSKYRDTFEVALIRARGRQALRKLKTRRHCLCP